ncbi:MAG: hypothetical protein HGB08_00290 [Candidatus Moranbacteria bacterium]|nr:hypothetical protein [Candidatus Moranbacteria bacterium]
MFGYMINSLRSMLKGFTARLFWAMLFVAMATLLGMATIASFHFFMIGGSARLFCWSSVIIVAVVAASAVRLVFSWRTLQVHIAGEVIEFSGAAFQLFGSSKTATATGILDNPATRLYLDMIRWVLAIQLLFLVIFQNYLCGLEAFASSSVVMTIVLMTTTVLALLGKWSLSKVLLRWIITATLMFYILSGVSIGFPQAREFLGLNSLSFTPRSTAQLINKIRDVQSQQTEAANNQLLAEALGWQKANPGKKLPAEYSDAISAAQKNMTVDEYHRWQKEQQALSDKASAEKAKSDVNQKNEDPVKSLPMKLENGYATVVCDLQPGNYILNPYFAEVSFDEGRSFKKGPSFSLENKMCIRLRCGQGTCSPLQIFKK